MANPTADDESNYLIQPDDPTDSPAGAALAGPLQAHIVNAPSGESSPQDSANTQPPAGAHRAADADPDPDGVRTVVIHEGDTLNSVARANLGSDEPVVIRIPLKASPQLANANLIHPGEVLQVPGLGPHERELLARTIFDPVVSSLDQRPRRRSRPPPPIAWRLIAALPGNSLELEPAQIRPSLRVWGCYGS